MIFNHHLNLPLVTYPTSSTHNRTSPTQKSQSLPDLSADKQKGRSKHPLRNHPQTEFTSVSNVVKQEHPTQVQHNQHRLNLNNNNKNQQNCHNLNHNNQHNAQGNKLQNTNINFNNNNNKNNNTLKLLPQQITLKHCNLNKQNAQGTELQNNTTNNTRY